jgi:hypothetical protein
MRKDTSFSEKKLTNEEFSDKYWMGGKAPHQYHTASIEDGRDEREQFLFNNCRALYDLIKIHSERQRVERSSLEKDFENTIKKVTKLAVTSLAINSILIITILLLWFK